VSGKQSAEVHQPLDVLIAVRYPAPWFRETLEGLSRQTFSDFSIVLVIHGCDIGLSKLAQSYFPYLQVVLCTEHVELSEVRDAGLNQCSAPLVAVIDSDDVPLPNRFEKQVSFLGVNRDVAMVTSPLNEINELGFLTGKSRGSQRTFGFKQLMIFRNSVGHSSVMFRREIAQSVGGYRQGTSGVDDYDLWLRISVHHRIGILNSCETLYRVHEHQTSKKLIVNAVGLDKLLESRLALARPQHVPRVIVQGMHYLWTKKYIRSFALRSDIE
jgi:glycosyltransferase involved in cell wall biosynthesis